MKLLVSAVILLLVVVVAVVVFLGKQRAMPTTVDPFVMKIDDRFAVLTDGKVVVVGVVSTGEVRPGDSLDVQSATSRLPVSVESLEAYHKPLKRAAAGDRVAIMLVGATKADINPGDVLKGEGK